MELNRIKLMLIQQNLSKCVKYYNALASATGDTTKGTLPRFIEMVVDYFTNRTVKHKVKTKYDVYYDHLCSTLSDECIGKIQILIIEDIRKSLERSKNKLIELGYKLDENDFNI